MGGAAQAEGRALQRHRGRKDLGWGSRWRMLPVTCAFGGVGRQGPKEQIFMALLFVQVPSKGCKLGSGAFRSLLREEVGWISPSPGPSLLLHSGMFYL